MPTGSSLARAGEGHGPKLGAQVSPPPAPTTPAASSVTAGIIPLTGNLGNVSWGEEGCEGRKASSLELVPAQWWSWGTGGLF